MIIWLDVEGVDVAAIAGSLEIVEVVAGLVAVETELKMWLSWLLRH